MPATTWYLMIHRLPVRPLYFRARVRRLLAEAGAVPLKKAVYALPMSAQGLERLTRIADEVRSGGGEAFVCEARFTGDRDAAALMETIRKERSADYRRILRDAQALRQAARAAGRRPREGLKANLDRIRARLEHVRSIDPSPDDREARAAIESIERLLHPPRESRAAGALSSLVGRTWVTRRGLHVDRLACAWVVRRFIDPGARFRFTDPGDLHAGPDELTFDTPEGRFSHREGRCSVETLLIEAGIADDAVRRIAEIVHDLDLKDDRFRHPETAGIERLIAGIVQGHDDDRARLDRGLALFDDLYSSYRTNKRVVLQLDHPPTPPPRGPRGAT
jgi:hypothetical protein